MDSSIIIFKKAVLVSTLLLSAFSGFSQIVMDSIRSIATQIPVKWSSGNNFQTERLDAYTQILNTDVIGYFKLEKQYDTELKQKMFFGNRRRENKKIRIN